MGTPYKHFLKPVIIVASSVSLDNKSFKFPAHSAKEHILIQLILHFCFLH